MYLNKVIEFFKTRFKKGIFIYKCDKINLN